MVLLMSYVLQSCYHEDEGHNIFIIYICQLRYYVYTYNNNIWMAIATAIII